MELNKNIQDYELVFLDLETTGLDVVMGDTICEIGAVKVRQGRIIDKFQTLINPQRKIPQEAYRVHKISDADTKFAPIFGKVVDKLISFTKNSVVCAYNVSFDMGFVDYQLKSLDYGPLSIPAVDILAMARDALELSRYNLESVAKYLNIDCSGGLHRALDDALIAYQVFFKLITIFADKGISNLDEFICLYGFNNEIFQTKESKRIALIKDAIEGEKSLNLKYFSLEKEIQEETMMPLRILQENRYFYLLYQTKDKTSSRIRSNRILNIESA
tara:strand:+ start:6973 stop:7791 length:819 start_codon:yes stop_codon:yes gene_type:complete